MSRKKKIIIGLMALFLLFLIVRTAMGKMSIPFSSMDNLGMWIGGFLTIFIMSFLYQDNPFYKFAEHLFIGVSAAYWMVMGFWTTLMPNCILRLAPKWFLPFNPELINNNAEIEYILPLILGCMMLCLLIPSIGWLARWTLSFIVAATAGTYFTRYLISDFLKQIEQTMVPLISIGENGFLFGETFSTIVTVFGIFAGLAYFFYSKEHKGLFGKVSKFGIWILMISFGALFGYTVQGRIALLVGRMQDIFINWLEIIPKS